MQGRLASLDFDAIIHFKYSESNSSSIFVYRISMIFSENRFHWMTKNIFFQNSGNVGLLCFDSPYFKGTLKQFLNAITCLIDGRHRLDSHSC